MEEVTPNVALSKLTRAIPSGLEILEVKPAKASQATHVTQ
jgi:hypothetical protein